LHWPGAPPTISGQDKTMAGFTRNNPQKATADEIAKSLLQVMVEEEAESGHPSQFDLPATVWPQFRAKMRLYREAVVLMLLLSWVEKEKTWEDVLKAYEMFILPDTPSTEGITKLEALKGAMARLRKLFHPQGPGEEFSWSKDWMAGIGHEETNPARLMQFACYWMSDYTAVAKSLAGLCPSH
jgi:hypothetical protein